MPLADIYIQGGRREAAKDIPDMAAREEEEEEEKEEEEEENLNQGMVKGGGCHARRMLRSEPTLTMPGGEGGGDPITPHGGGNNDDNIAALEFTSASKSPLLRNRSMLSSVPLPSVVYRPWYQPAKPDDLAVTAHRLGQMVRAGKGIPRYRGLMKDKW